MAMTLGTVYSALNNYDKSRKYYVKSIDEAVRAGDRNFAAIAYYNLSLLEHKFLHYNSALRTTDDSLAMEDRPSGHLARGELFQSRMDFRSALEEYQKAYAKDTTPLSKVNLGILFQRFGRLELARRYAEDAFASKDLAWMVYYGTDVSRHLKDIHTLLADVYWGLSRMEAGKPTVGPIERLAALLSSVRYMVLSWHNRQRYRLLALKVGGELLEQGSYENAYWEFYQGNMMYPEVGLKYLGMARKTETARLPHTRYFYLQEEGYVRRSAKLLEESIKGIDPFWEREALARSLAALAPLLEGQENAVRKREVLERLFEIDRGALQQEGLGLPLSVEFRGAGWGKREMGLIVRYMKRAYSECAPAMRHTLRINRGEGGNFQWAVRDSRSGGVVAQGTSPIAGPTKARCARLLRAILEELYAVH
jgi:tetratricopeptide (TPR) repeat protein